MIPYTSGVQTLIIASDGVWDFLSSSDVESIVSKLIAEHGGVVDDNIAAATCSAILRESAGMYTCLVSA